MEATCNECDWDFEVDPDDNEYLCPFCGAMDVTTYSDSDYEDDDS